MFSDSHRVALTLQVIFQRASGTILSHDTRGQSLAKPPERTDRTDESRPENADNEQQQERVSQRRGFICYIVVKHNEKIRHPKYSGSGTAKDQLVQWMDWTRKGDVKTRGEMYTILNQQLISVSSCKLPEITERIKKLSVTVAHMFLDDRIQANAATRSASSWWVQFRNPIKLFTATKTIKNDNFGIRNYS